MPLRWRRTPRRVEMTLDLPAETAKAVEHEVPDSDGLRVAVSVRPVKALGIAEGMVPDGTRSVSVFLVNHRIPGSDEHAGRAVHLPGRAGRPLGRAADPPAQPQGPRDRGVGRAGRRPAIPRRLRVCRGPRHRDPCRDRRPRAPAAPSAPAGFPRPRSSASPPPRSRTSSFAWRPSPSWPTVRPPSRPSGRSSKQYRDWIEDQKKVLPVADPQAPRDGRGPVSTGRHGGQAHRGRHQGPRRQGRVARLPHGQPRDGQGRPPALRPDAGQGRGRGRGADLAAVPARLHPDEPARDRGPAPSRPGGGRSALLPDRRRQDRGLPRPGGLHPGLSPPEEPRLRLGRA